MNYNYILQKQESFELKDIFDCGQCFRWNRIDANCYIGVVSEYVIKVSKSGNKIEFTATSNAQKSDKEFETFMRGYFDLDSNYDEYKSVLSNVDDNLKKAVEYGKGIRILKQDLLETIISYIISANNNIPRIKKIVEKMCETLGEKITFEGKDYYTFPTMERLIKTSQAEFRSFGMGFRDKYVYQTIQELKNIDFMQLELLKTEDLEKQLMKFNGIGEKVANCILLFSTLHRFDVFPIDVWVRRVMNELYFNKANEKELKNNEIMELVKDKFGNLAGLAQQYLFYYRRENENT